MKISEIRDIIDSALWLKRDFQGHTREEFVKAAVGPRLSEKIAELEALAIPARFVRDIERRNDTVRYCRELIADWNRELTTPAPVSTEHRCIWLGSTRCLHCGAKFKG